jgi:uncharacterized protein (TIGR02594 family)
MGLSELAKAVGSSESERLLNTYIVQPGDYPMKIAQRCGLSFAQFSALNPGMCSGTQCRVLRVGERVNIGSPVQAATPVYRPQPQPQTQMPPWMQIAQGELGQREWKPGDNPRIQQYLASVGIAGPDETSWCGAFVNWCLRVAGYRAANTGMAAAWSSFGRSVQPVYGAIAVLSPLATGSSGHVGFLHAITGDRVWLLSGNSASAVRLSSYPQSKLVALRWPA